MPDDSEKGGLIFIPRDGGELADVLREFTGSPDVESVRTDREDVAADVVAGIKREDEMIESFRTGAGNRFKQLLDRIFSLPAMTEVPNAENCDGDCANCRLHDDVDVGQRSHEAKESQIPGWRKFVLKVPFNPTWSDDFVHASELFLPICTMIAEDCKADLIEGENIVAVNNFRIQEVMEANSVDIYIGFSVDVSKEFEELGKPTFLMSLKTDKGRNISVRGYRRECEGKRILNPLGGVADMLYRHVSVTPNSGSFHFESVNENLRETIVNEFKELEWAGTNSYLLMEILTCVASLLDGITMCFGGRGFMVASFECDSLPESEDYLDNGFDIQLSFDHAGCKPVKKEAGTIVPLNFVVSCLGSGKVCKCRLTIFSPGGFSAPQFLSPQPDLRDRT